MQNANPTMKVKIIAAPVADEDAVYSAEQQDAANKLQQEGQRAFLGMRLLNIAKLGDEIILKKQVFNRRPRMDSLVESIKESFSKHGVLATDPNNALIIALPKAALHGQTSKIMTILESTQMLTLKPTYQKPVNVILVAGHHRLDAVKEYIAPMEESLAKKTEALRSLSSGNPRAVNLRNDTESLHSLLWAATLWAVKVYDSGEFRRLSKEPAARRWAQLCESANLILP